VADGLGGCVRAVHIERAVPRQRPDDERPLDEQHRPRPCSQAIPPSVRKDEGHEGDLDAPCGEGIREVQGWLRGYRWRPPRRGALSHHWWHDRLHAAGQPEHRRSAGDAAATTDRGLRVAHAIVEAARVRLFRWRWLCPTLRPQSRGAGKVPQRRRAGPRLHGHGCDGVT
jgi:hypothetical protein